MNWNRRSKEGLSVFWTGTLYRQSWLSYILLRIALWIDRVPSKSSGYRGEI